MARISRTAMLAATKVARDVVTRRFGEDWGYCRRAALAVNQDDPARVGADRRFLQTILRHGLGGRWQERTLNRLATLLEKIEPGSAVRVARAVRSKKATRLMNEHRRGSEWAELPDSIELIRAERQLSRPHRALIRKFVEWAEDQGHGPWRIRLAKARVLAPLVCYARTLGVERGWHELTTRERSQFIEAGIARERIMLRVAPAHIRAMERFPTPDLDFALDALDVPKTEELKKKIEEQWMRESRGDWVGSEPPEGLEDEGRRRAAIRPGRRRGGSPAKRSPRGLDDQEPTAQDRVFATADPKCERCGTDLQADVDMSGYTVWWCPRGCERSS